jgi:hypothetical protein
LSPYLVILAPFAARARASLMVSARSRTALTPASPRFRQDCVRQDGARACVISKKPVTDCGSLRLMRVPCDRRNFLARSVDVVSGALQLSCSFDLKERNALMQSIGELRLT